MKQEQTKKVFTQQKSSEEVCYYYTQYGPYKKLILKKSVTIQFLNGFSEKLWKFWDIKN